ncbi:zz type zinc finger domain-containing [Pyrenophora seminiperda CCB06]|uniref:Zz type zinc finger domain-containing n=1 Tax=Pyrenophora seminiperda CCB06 TaxID=1302712 RepID=A0A3M7M225_9PLEO|nr:zz type zinc finger domain-containing [Pyrenophora seminiperda CCB06]
MGLDDIFAFDVVEYTAKMSLESDESLKKREVVKMRQLISSTIKAGFGVGGAYFTGGLSLVGSVYAARQYSVAEQKLAIVQKELEKRKIGLHEMRKRDYAIPITSCYVGLGLACGVDQLASVGTNTGVMGGCVEHAADASVVSNFAREPEDFVSGAIAGAQEQVSEVSQATHAAIDVQTSSSTSEMMQQHLADNTVWVPANSAEEAVVFHQGMVMMQATERNVASIAGFVATSWALDKALDNTVEKSGAVQKQHKETRA